MCAIISALNNGLWPRGIGVGQVRIGFQGITRRKLGRRGRGINEPDPGVLAQGITIGRKLSVARRQ
jgi:hypothetical protein